MIITRRKDFKEILSFLKDAKQVFLLGCALCATTCKTGGENELKDMQKALEKEGKRVTGSAVLDPACSLLEVKRLYRGAREEIDESEGIVSLACGGGNQAVSEIIKDKEIFPANDTLFQGEITSLTLKESRFDQKCSLCGECVLAETGAICPTTRCSKGLVNGPCGGVKNGKCEVDARVDCAWLLIYEKLKRMGRLDTMKRIKPPKDHSKAKKPQNLIVK